MGPPLRGRDDVSFSDAYYGLQTTLRGKHLTNRAKSVIRVRSESGHGTSFVGHPDGDSAGNESGDDTDGAMPPKPILSRFIALLRSFLGVSTRCTGLQLTSGNRGYPCSRRSLTESMDKMTVPRGENPNRDLYGWTLVERALLEWY
jgi:hypothetical protein